MKITDYYYQSSKASLNSSIVFLFPAVLLITYNIFFMNNKQAMALCLPALVISLVYFQNHLACHKKAIYSNLGISGQPEHLLKENNFLVFFEAKIRPGILLFSEDGVKIGELRKVSPFYSFFGQRIELRDCRSSILAMYTIRKKDIFVTDSGGRHIGNLVKNNEGWSLSMRGREVASIVSARLFMDVKIVGEKIEQAGRLRRGMMPIGWKAFASDPNAPVFTLHSCLANEERVLFMSVLVKEFFVER